MGPVQQGQTLATFNAEGEVVTTGNAGTAQTETITSGTAFQVSATRAAKLYINVRTAASLEVQMGPTSAGNTITIDSGESEALGVTTLHVPAGWYVLLTGTTADFVATAVLE